MGIAWHASVGPWATAGDAAVNPLRQGRDNADQAASPRDLRDRVDRVDPPSTAGEDLVDDVGDEAAQEALPGPGIVVGWAP